MLAAQAVGRTAAVRWESSQQRVNLESGDVLFRLAAAAQLLGSAAAYNALANCARGTAAGMIPKLHSAVDLRHRAVGGDPGR
jgi:prophage antirepressor-like protein